MKKIFKENGLLSGKRVLAATLVMVLLSSMTFFSAAAGHTWKSQGNVEAIKSDGSKTVVFDKSDLDYLDGRIDAIEADVSTGKENLANALNPLGTNPSLGTPLSGTSTFNELMEAINHSQAIPDKTIGESVSIATEDYELASKVTGQTINSDTKISAATADNLSLGTSAWVDGSLLIGTGADNKNYYEQATTPIYISSIALSASASANSNVSNDSSVGTNKTVSSSSGSSSFSISIKGYSKLSIQSGTCSYSLKDSSGIKSNASGTITGNDAIGIYGYDLLTLSYTTSAWKESIGTHNSGTSCSSSIHITGIEIK